MEPSELVRRFWESWFGFGRSFTNWGARTAPFSAGETAPPPHSDGHRNHRPEGTEDGAARAFVSVLGRLNGMSEAQAKIVHAWIGILLNRMNGAVGAPGRDGEQPRKPPLDELIDGYVAFSRESVGVWTALLANMSNPQRR